MKRSRVNDIIARASDFIASCGFVLPPFAGWTPEDMRARVATDAAPIRDARLGWDVTDYGAGRFDEMGLVLFTLRNGSALNVAKGAGMLYAEKLLISEDRQLSPMHRHERKTEDIINRGGGTLVIELFTRSEDGGIDEAAGVVLRCDAVERRLPPGGLLALAPGESVTLEPWHWHAFWAEGGRVLIGEVSNVNDDLTDNIFRDPIGRFSDIEEDTGSQRLLVSDYDRWLE
ncbi:D-lyxose/D-mannose family sugar isomerase [Anianabacter salinae]|uniref:D-lyxose/D-mannose family sugar isomerase n=1 Tax=Anianabacter salinae TaxID=2851023 RepID=UPI00225E2C97|nr:D-lyxose/D-mannose family sugar isomerase [Anianabacter salinae]MBV0912017.1 D-lyxose/D-mannose family sugar isomerase [Anianabacter salinae]